VDVAVRPSIPEDPSCNLEINGFICVKVPAVHVFFSFHTSLFLYRPQHDINQMHVHFRFTSHMHAHSLPTCSILILSVFSFFLSFFLKPYCCVRNSTSKYRYKGSAKAEHEQTKKGVTMLNLTRRQSTREMDTEEVHFLFCESACALQCAASGTQKELRTDTEWDTEKEKDSSLPPSLLYRHMHASICFSLSFSLDALLTRSWGYTF